MLFMVIERFKKGPDVVRERFATHGRVLPDGVKYISSWITEDARTCYQLMEAENVEGFEPWTQRWRDIVDFEIHRVTTSGEFNGSS